MCCKNAKKLLNDFNLDFENVKSVHNRVCTHSFVSFWDTQLS